MPIIMITIIIDIEYIHNNKRKQNISWTNKKYPQNYLTIKKKHRDERGNKKECQWENERAQKKRQIN